MDQKDFLGQRPKRPLTGYGRFLQEYFSTHNGVSGVDGFRSAALEWNCKSQEEKLVYIEQTAEERNQYQLDISQWRQRKDALKRPPTPFPLFLRDVWISQRDSGTQSNVPDVARIASERWREMPDCERDEYTAIHAAMMARYRAEQEKLRREGTMDLEWRSQVMTAKRAKKDEQLSDEEQQEQGEQISMDAEGDETIYNGLFSNNFLGSIFGRTSKTEEAPNSQDNI